MHKRFFMAGCAAAFSKMVASRSEAGPADRPDGNRIQASGVTFSWRHADGRLHARLSAPTKGWIASGFNADQGLRGTRFVIAHVAIRPIRVEEHIALVPAHKNVTDLGMDAALQDTSGNFEGGYSHLQFSLPVQFADHPRLSLKPGATVNLMLAWSQGADFNHHSAWRRHFDITL